MFDPTAYENFKVIIEGSVYDYDFTGDIKVVNRSELIDLAVLSRQFTMSFIMPDYSRLIGSIVLRASLNELAGEILEEDDTKAAAKVILQFTYHSSTLATIEKAESIKKCLLNIWGEDRHVSFISSQHFTDGQHSHYSNEVTVSFNRMVREDLADDLYELPKYMMESLQALRKHI